MTRGTSNVAIAYRGDEDELAFGYTQSGASGTDVTPIANGGLDVRVYGNLFANNLTTTANVEATYLKGDGSEITQITLDQVVGYANTTANTIQLTNSDVGLKVTGNVEANYFVGDGSKLTNMSTTLQAISDNGNVTSNTIQFTNATTAFIAESNVGIGTATPSANLHVAGYQYVNDPPTITNSFDHSDAPLTLTHGTATSSTAINDPKPVLHLTRDGTTSQSYGARASFNLSRYENSGTASRSRLDLALADGTYAESTVMTLRSDGKVGVGTVTPTYTLDVHGSANVGALTATTISGPLSGNASTATALQTARTIGGVSFDGTADINLPGVNAQGTQDTIGNAATATTAVNQSGGTVNATTGHFSGDLILESNLRVNGSLTYANTVNMIVSDPIMELGANNQHTNDLGLVLTRHGNSGNDSNVAIFYDESADNLKIGYTDDNATQTTLSTTATGLDVSITGNVAAAYDTDTVSYFGRAAVGYMGQSDQASFSHLDKNTSANFALKQAASGATHLNTPTGQHIRFSVNASEVGRFTGGGDFKVGANKLLVEPATSEVKMYSQATGSTAGPELVLMRDNPNNGSNGDYIGQIRYEGRNDNGGSRLFAKTTGKIKIASNNSESGILETMLVTGGTNRISLRHTGELFHINKGTDFQVGEVANLYVDTSTSTVGIGTASPIGKLQVDIADASAATAAWDATKVVFGDIANGNSQGLGFGVSTDSHASIISLAPGVAWRGLSYYSSWHKWYINDVEKMTLDASGNVGIGESSPAQKLDVDGRIRANTMEIDDFIYHVGDTDTSFGFSGADTFAVYTGNSLRLLADSNGNVGIGVSNPSHKLDVSGDINFTGSLLQNGSAFQGSQWTESNSNIYYEANVAIGTTTVTSGARLEVKGPLRVSNATATYSCDLVTTEPTGGWTTRETYNNWTNDEYGQQVAISADGTTAVVGSPYDDSGGYTNAGRAYVYLFGSNGYWQKVCVLSASDLSYYPALAQQGQYMQHSGKNVDITDDGSVIIVGAPMALNTNNNKRAGAVYVYVRPSSGWGSASSPSVRNEIARLRMNGGFNDEWLGHSCAISGDGSMVVAGIPGYAIPNYADNYYDSRAGIVLGFMRNMNSGNQWGGSYSIQTEQTMFFPNPHIQYISGARNWMYGRSVAINYDATTIVIGAPGYEDANPSITSYGTAYVHAKPSNGWPSTHHSGIKLTTGTTWFEMQSMYLGESIAMDQYGDTIILGAPFQNYTYPTPPSGVAAGPRVFIYKKPTASGGWLSLNQYGWTSSTSGPALHPPSGSIQASDMDTSSSAETGRFGRAIDMAKDGSAIVVGSPLDDTPAGNSSGSLYVYEKPSSGWAQGSTIITTHAAKLLPTSRHSADDEFGISVSVSNYLTSGTHANKYVILGGSHKDDVTSSTTNSGAVWFFMGVPAVPQALTVSTGLTASGDITASGTIAATSDERLKADIEKIQNALDKIELLNGYTYTMKDTRTRRYTGLIAQEVLSVLPEVVCGSEDTNYALAYGNMMGLVVEAIKEMRGQIRNIEAQL